MLQQVANNTKTFTTENNKRGAALVRVFGEEHDATAWQGRSTMYLFNDIDLCYISELKFKLIFEEDPTDAALNQAVSVALGYKTWANIQEFINAYPIGTAIDADGVYGCQCYDYANAFWRSQVNRNLVNNNGGASGTWALRDQNAGTEFVTGTNWDDIQRGDWVVWDTGVYGHIALALGSPDSMTKTISVLEENGPNGTPWPTGGTTLSVGTGKQSGFLGYFRYKW